MALTNDALDLKLDPLTGDLDITNGKPSFVRGLDGVVQAVSIRLKVFRGEWFRDLLFGIPYYQEILGKKFNQQLAIAAFRTIILDTPNVIEILSLSAEFDRTTRIVTIKWSARTEFGDTTLQVTVL